MDPASSTPAMPPWPSPPPPLNDNNSPHHSDTTPSNHNHNHNDSPPPPTHDTSNHLAAKPPLQSSQSHNFFTYPMTYAVSGILRRLSTDPLASSKSQNPSRSSSLDNSLHDSTNSEIFHAPKRTASPFQPPPLTPLTLSGWRTSTKENARLLTRALAEEIRLLVPARLQLVSDWKLIYSLEQDGTSLSTLYALNSNYRGRRGAFVLVVRDGKSSTFGAYLSDALYPSAHYYGTGECFLWKASVAKMLDLTQLQLDLPPPPSEDTTDMNVRTTTLLSPKSAKFNGVGSVSGTNTPERMRFKAFPYSGVNDYMIFCESGYLSVGGGDGHYGLWLDDSLDKGVSSTCLTFGNEPLSEEGGKFNVMGVELWYIGN